MKLIKFFKALFWKKDCPANPFSEAISEGIKDTFIKMGYDNAVKDKT